MRSILGLLLLFAFLFGSATDPEIFEGLCEESTLVQAQSSQASFLESSSECPEEECPHQDCDDCHCCHQHHRGLEIRGHHSVAYFLSSTYRVSLEAGFYKQPFLEPNRKPPKHF